jgi:hypothetical protein
MPCYWPDKGTLPLVIGKNKESVRLSYPAYPLIMGHAGSGRAAVLRRGCFTAG